MKRKPLFITLILSAAAIGIVLVILFVRDNVKQVTKAEPAETVEPETEHETIKPENNGE